MKIIIFVFVFFVFFVLSIVNGLTLDIFCYYPQNSIRGKNLYMRGNAAGLSWATGIQLKNIKDNTFHYQLSYQTPQTIEYKILVNDKDWQVGANTVVSLPSSSSSVSVYPWFYTSQGNYVYVRDVYSPQLNNTRNLVVYYPPSYLENTLKNYSNVLVMHDGQNLFNASTSFAGVAWECQNTVDQLIGEGNIEEIIIIGVDNTPDRTNELTYSFDSSVGAGGKGDLYLDFVEQTVIPLIKQQFRISSNANLGILGSSLGGLISCYAGWTRSDVYLKAGCMSSSFWWDNMDFNGIILKNNKVPSGITFYLDSGNAGPDNDDVTQTKQVLAHMEQLGFSLNQTIWYYLDNGGQHSEYYWGNRFWIPMTDLYSVTPTPTSPN